MLVQALIPVFTASLLMAVGLSAVAPTALSEDLEPKVLRFASGTQSEPFTQLKDGDVRGIYQEILSTAFVDSGYSIQVTTYPPGRVIWELKQGAIDLFPHFQVKDLLGYQEIENTQVCERVIFSVKVSLFSLQDRQPKVISENNGVRVGWVRYHHVDTKNLVGYIPADAEVVYAGNYKQLVKLLVAGRVDYVVSSSPNFHANLKQLAPGVTVVEQNVLPSAVVRLGFSRQTLKADTEDIREYFCQALADMHKKGIVEQIVSKYSHLSYFDPL